MASLRSCPGRPSLRAPPPFAALLPALLATERNPGKSEALDAAPVVRRVPAAVRHPAVGAVAEPAAAPEHPARAPFLVEVLTPLPHVAMHVAQAQLVRRIRTDLGRPPQIGPLVCLACRIIAVEVRLLRGQVVGRLGKVEVEGTFY